MPDLDASRYTRNLLLLPSGRIDRRAVTVDAHRQYRQMKAHGRSWGRCLTFNWARARVMHDRAQAAARWRSPRSKASRRCIRP